MNKPDFNLLAEDTYPDGENMCSIKRKAFVTGAAAIWNLQSVVPSSGKSLEECKEIVAAKNQYGSWDDVQRFLSNVTFNPFRLQQLNNEAAELYAKSCTEELRKENEELRRRINELEFPEYPQDQREAVGKILAENITFSPQAGGWVIHGAIDKIIQWASLPSAPIEKT